MDLIVLIALCGPRMALILIPYLYFLNIKNGHLFIFVEHLFGSDINLLGLKRGRSE